MEGIDKMAVDQITGIYSHPKHTFLVSIRKDADFVRDNFDTITPGELGQIGERLSINNINLGALVSSLGLIADQCKQDNGDEEARLFLELTEMTEAKRKMYIRQQLKDNKRIELLNKYTFNYYRSLKSDIDRLVSMIQSRLKTLNNEWSQSRAQSYGNNT